MATVSRRFCYKNFTDQEVSVAAASLKTTRPDLWSTWTDREKADLGFPDIAMDVFKALGCVGVTDNEYQVGILLHEVRRTVRIEAGLPV